MQSALHITTKVLPGNRIEIELPPGSEGQEVNVFIVLPEQSQAKRGNLKIIEEARRHRIGMTAEQIDDYLLEERASWDF